MSSVKSTILALFSIAGIVAIQLHSYEKVDDSKNSNVLVSQWEEDVIRQQLELSNAVPKFGYRNLFADWQFLRFLQYFGNSQLRKAVGYKLSTNYFEGIVDSDPLFSESYIFLVNTISMYLGEPEESIRLVEKGLQHMGPALPPRSYFIWRHKATDELLFLGNTQAAKKSHETAADWAELSPDEEGDFVAALSRKTIEFLETDPNSKPAQIRAWSDVLLRATDDNIRQKAAAEIEALGGTIVVNNSGQVTVRYKRDGE